MRTCAVIIPCYNTPLNLLNRCLASIANQTTTPEVIVVDDHSEGDTREFLKSACDGYGWQLIRHRKCRGVAWARNTAVWRTNTDYIAICDSDDYWEPTKLEVQLQAFDRGVKAVVCGTKIQYLTEPGYLLDERSTPNDLLRDAIVESSFLRQMPDTERFRSHYAKLIRCNFSFCGSNTVFDAETLKCNGGFNEGLNGADEWDALLHVAKDYRINVVPHHLCNYTRRKYSFSTSPSNIEQLRKTCERIIYTHRLNLTDSERVLLNSVPMAEWACALEKSTFLPNTPYPIVQYHA